MMASECQAQEIRGQDAFQEFVPVGVFITNYKEEIATALEAKHLEDMDTVRLFSSLIVKHRSPQIDTPIAPHPPLSNGLCSQICWKIALQRTRSHRLGWKEMRKPMNEQNLVQPLRFQFYSCAKSSMDIKRAINSSVSADHMNDNTEKSWSRPNSEEGYITFPAPNHAEGHLGLERSVNYVSSCSTETLWTLE